MIVRDGGGGLDKRLVDIGCFAVGDILLWLFFEFGTKCGDKVFFLHWGLAVQQLYYYFD